MSGFRAAAVTSEETARGRIAALLAGASIEISARDRNAVESCRRALRPGTTVYINFAPGDTHLGVAAAASQLRRAGFEPVPHVAARYLASFTQLDDFLARATGEAGVAEVLAIAGDIDPPAGPFHASLQALATGLFEKHGIRRVGLAGYPEGHPRIAAAQLDQALAAKLELVERLGLAPHVVTQFCFAAAPIREWLGRLRSGRAALSVRVGLAGPASIATLAKFAVRCGIGNSLKALVARQTSIARLVKETGPEAVIAALAETARPADRIAGLHFFTFGGSARTAAWLGAIQAGRFETGAGGFRAQG